MSECKVCKELEDKLASIPDDIYAWLFQVKEDAQKELAKHEKEAHRFLDKLGKDLENDLTSHDYTVSGYGITGQAIKHDKSKED